MVQIGFVFFFQAEDGIRDSPVTGFRRVLFRSPAQKVVMIIGKQNEAAIPIHKIAAVVLIGEFGSLFVVCSFIPYLYSVFKQEGSINTFTTV